MEQQIAKSGNILCDIVNTGLRQLFPVTVAVKHTDRIDLFSLASDDIMFASPIMTTEGWSVKLLLSNTWRITSPFV